MKKLLIFFSSVFLLSGCGNQSAETIRYPYSQWTVGFSGHHLYWSYSDSLIMNASFISRPETGWEQWFEDLLDYRELALEKISVEEPFIKGYISSSEPAKIHFDKFGYDLNLKAGEKLSISGKIKSPETQVKIHLGYELKTKKQELSYVIRKAFDNADSISFFSTESPQFFNIDSDIPEFNADSFSITPVITIKAIKHAKKYPLTLTEITLEVEKSTARLKLKDLIEQQLVKEREYPKFKAHQDLLWMNQNYVMGFVFLWDNDFWDHTNQSFRVDHYCDKMQREFGGFNSVLIWHSYPNLGIDKKNQFDFLYNIPDGLDGFKTIVEEFHRKDIKVFITYNPWDLDTRRPENSDGRELSKIVNYCDVDGIFLDTWRSSTGVISIFSQERFLREEIEKDGKKVAFVTETLPEIKDLAGYNSLSGSWGQEINPFHYTDLSHIKWLLPWHKQYFIKRMKKNRKRELSHAWVNGQGVLVWENIFGTMNPWHAEDRQTLRKMNTIWKRFGEVYLTPEWKPLVIRNELACGSSWKVNGFKIWNIANITEKNEIEFKLEIDTTEGKYFYDIWNGAQVYPLSAYGTNHVSLKINDFSCLLQTDSTINHFHEILLAQQIETIKILPGIFEDRHIRELSLKKPVKYDYENQNDSLITPNFLKVPEGNYSFTTRHISREGACYPDEDAVDNHDLRVIDEKGYPEIIHTHSEYMGEYYIMPEVVTNGEFELFLTLSGYTPESKENFLKHWNGRECPDEIKNDPVVYVSLSDARAFSEWAGMKLPTEWQWQKAAEYHPREFIFNEVFEWNESERFDGYNHFVNLRGGNSQWLLPTSWWYFPGAPYGETVGGVQPYDSHIKYFLMYPGLDRASTIGFRCVWEKPDNQEQTSEMLYY
ncbi:MAG: SUMF1/EgtB/PvdO family nonheme iron enzyme [Bacteroidota bacterium]